MRASTIIWKRTQLFSCNLIRSQFCKLYLNRTWANIDAVVIGGSIKIDQAAAKLVKVQSDL